MRRLLCITVAIAFVACDEKQKPADVPRPPPNVREPVAPPSPATPLPAATPPEMDLTSPFSEKLPSGWRDLRFGMSEAEVRKLILRQKKTQDDWERTPATSLPIVHLGKKYVHDMSVDDKRFHHWNVWHLDDGADFVRAWFDGGKLVAVQHTGRIKLDAFLQKASEAYGVEPRVAELKFFDGTSMREEMRRVAVWRSNTTTALLWDGGEGTPKLLLWSTPAMDAQASTHQASLDAQEQRAKERAESKDKATTF